MRLAAALVPVVLSAAVAGAHFWRAGQPGLQWLAWASPLLLLFPRPWAARLLQVLLLAAAAVWIDAARTLVAVRQQAGAPWTRLAVILGGVALLAVVSAAVFRLPAVRRRYLSGGTSTPNLAAAALAALLVGFVHTRVQPPMLLAERLVPGLGWLEVGALAAYAAWAVDGLLDAARAARFRVRIWAAFSAVFFGQALLGLLGADVFLLSGRLHVPVPAVIVGGPLFRGEGLFMPLLVGATLLLVGPAWCSHLCYVGAWDAAAAGRQPRALRTSRLEATLGFRRWLPWLNLALVVAAALGLRALGAPSALAAALALAFGLAGVGVMLVFSRRAGAMAHCVGFCPIGPVVTVLGRLNPFRLRVSGACTDCGACARACRYAALDPESVRRRRPARTCTLCGDCLAHCPCGALELRLPGVGPGRSRVVFVVLVVALHAAFLGLARL